MKSTKGDTRRPRQVMQQSCSRFWVDLGWSGGIQGLFDGTDGISR